MTGQWVRLDADYFHHPKVLAAGRDGRDLHLASICWVAKYRTDGAIPDNPETRRILLGDAGARPSAIELVVAAGLWEPNGHGWVLHNYLVRNPSREDVEREREQWREQQRRARARQKGN